MSPKRKEEKIGSGSAEPLEVVDRNDIPIAVMDGRQVHRQTLMHRSVLILLYDEDGRVYLQKRDSRKEPHPGQWDASVCGHVRCLESREDAAIRELYEKLGLNVPRLSRIATLAASPSTGHEFVTVFSTGKVRHSPHPDKRHIENGYFFDASELACFTEQFRELLTPVLIQIWRQGLIFPTPEKC